MNKKYFITVVFFAIVSVAIAEDLAERAYFTSALPPKHKEKPPVKGWASKRIDEKLNRGLVAVSKGDGSMYLSWRLFKDDDPKIAFNVYRSVGDTPVKLNKSPITATTDFVDTTAPRNGKVTYWVQTVDNNRVMEAAVSEKVVCDPNTIYSKGCLSIAFQGDYTPSKIAVADLNGDGVYDFVIKQPGRGIDPGGRPDTRGNTYKLEAYLSDGTFLWRKDLGLGIEPGVWYSPYVVYDFDGDGKAEVAVKTGPADVRESDGRVRSGAEWCSILDGMTGKELARVDWPPRESRYGDYNRQSRNQMGIAYLDGKTPCLLVARGTYKLMVLDAYQYHDKELKQLWHWEGDDETPVIRSQGAHFMQSADVDGDGRDEVILGSAVIDDNGTCLWSAGLGHPDKALVTDIDPTHPGMEIFYAIEPHHDEGNGICMLDARTGTMLWSVGQKTNHVGAGFVADIDPSLPGLECWAMDSNKGDPNSRSSDSRPPRYLFSANGKLQAAGAAVPRDDGWVFWDADLLREVIASGGWFSDSGTSVAKYGGPTLTKGLAGRTIMTADILGDWREEIITAQSGKLCVYTTTIPASDRRVCLMQNPLYRADVANLSMGYPQPPLTDYYLGTPVADSAKAKPVISAMPQKPLPQSEAANPDDHD
jgi:rhamnogalacturonan endolyase